MRLALPMIVGKKITGYFELIKPLIDFKFESIQSRGNNVFELATREEIDKLGSTTRYSSATAEYTEDINLDEVINKSIKLFLISDLFSRFCSCYINNMTFFYILRMLIRHCTLKARWFTLKNGSKCCSWLVRS